MSRIQFKKSAVIAIVFLSVLLFWFLIYNNPRFFDDRSSILNIDPSKQVMRIELDGYLANIPSNYFFETYLFRGKWWQAPGDRLSVDNIEIRMTLPDLSPWNQDIAHKFLEPNGDVIIVGLSLMRNPQWKSTYLANAGSRLVPIASEDNIEGLLGYKDATTDENVFMTPDAQGDDFIRVICNLDRCRATYLYRERYEVSSRFPSRWLPNWRSMVFGVNARLNEFAVGSN